MMRSKIVTALFSWILITLVLWVVCVYMSPQCFQSLRCFLKLLIWKKDAWVTKFRYRYCRYGLVLCSATRTRICTLLVWESIGFTSWFASGTSLTNFSIVVVCGCTVPREVFCCNMFFEDCSLLFGSRFVVHYLVSLLSFSLPAPSGSMFDLWLPDMIPNQLGIVWFREVCLQWLPFGKYLSFCS